MTNPIGPKPPIPPRPPAPRPGDPSRPTPPLRPVVIPMVGRTLMGENRNQFLVHREFAEGGMATIYLVRDQNGRELLLKQMKDFPELPQEARSEIQLRFANEVGIMETINEMSAAYTQQHGPNSRLEGSNNVVKLIDRDRNPLPRWYVMEKIEGKDLYSAGLANPISPREALVIVGQTLQGLLLFEQAVMKQQRDRGQTLSQANFAHRDIKPENILLELSGSKTNRAVLTDFGIAKLPGSELTALNTFTGSLCWSSPKMLRGGSKEADVREDNFALGAILYWLFTAQEPFTFTDGNELGPFAHNPGPKFQELAAARPAQITPAMWALLFGNADPAAGLVMPGALRINAEDRFQTYSAFYSTLFMVFKQK
jgi:serine/threonine protein kinase